MRTRMGNAPMVHSPSDFIASSRQTRPFSAHGLTNFLLLVVAERASPLCSFELHHKGFVAVIVRILGDFHDGIPRPFSD
jgi:hypothetical protein